MGAGGYGGDGGYMEYRGEASGRKPPMLSERQHRALVEAIRALIDEILEDYANIYKGRNLADTNIFVECLPKQFQHCYSESFIKQFIVCIVAVSGRLAYWNGEEIAHSTGECLALYAVLERAILLLTLEDIDMGKTVEEDVDLDFRCFEKLAFVDGDYAFLFDCGLEDIAMEESADFKVVPLKLGDWFVPSYEEPAHPYLWVEDVPRREEAQCAEYESGPVRGGVILRKVATG